MNVATPHPETAAAPLDARHAELDRILGSAAFSKAPRLCALLNYIVEHSLSGHLDELTEQQIGIQVFGRSPGYNSAEDTIVRGTARHLRQRLDQYYSEEGRQDTVRLSVPKGGYVARFDDLAIAQPSAHDLAGPVPAETAEPSRGWPRAASVTVTLLAVALVMVAAWAFWPQRHPVDDQPLKGPQPLWQALFTAGRKTLIVPGDASLDTYIAWERRSVSLAEYTNQSYQQQTTTTIPPHRNDVSLATRSATPMADLRLTSELVRVPQWMHAPSLDPWIEVRYARDVVVADTHDNNLILIGSETFNPWVTLFRQNTDFYAVWDHDADVYSIVNKSPKTNEQAHYDYSRNSGKPEAAFTHIAFIDNSQGQGKVLIIEGTSMGTTYAAVAFLTHDKLWRPVMDAAIDKDNHLHNFEVLLSSDFVRGGTSNTKLVAIHVH